MQRDCLKLHVLNYPLVRELVVMMGSALGRGLQLGEDCNKSAPDSESSVKSLTSEGLAAFSPGPVNDKHFMSITVRKFTAFIIILGIILCKKIAT